MVIGCQYMVPATRRRHYLRTIKNKRLRSNNKVVIIVHGITERHLARVFRVGLLVALNIEASEFITKVGNEWIIAE